MQQSSIRFASRTMAVLIALSLVVRAVAMPQHDVVGWGGTGFANIADVSSLVEIALGGRHTIVVKRDGTVACWGDNEFGQCNVPTNVGPVAHVAACEVFTVALMVDGSIACRGTSAFGACSVPANLGRVARIAAGGVHTVALIERAIVGDLDGDGHVDASDVGVLLSAWGSSGGPADLNGDGIVGGPDLAVLLGAWTG